MESQEQALPLGQQGGSAGVKGSGKRWTVAKARPRHPRTPPAPGKRPGALGTCWTVDGSGVQDVGTESYFPL